MSPIFIRRLIFGIAPLVLLAVACSSGGDDADVARATASTTETVSALTFVVPNVGNSEMEGHTPRGFRGSGTGLFAGDNLNPAFPDGQGVQIFLTFDISGVPPGRVVSALLRSEHFTVRGTPFRDLGTLNAAEMVWDRFTPDLWDDAPIPTGASCVFATSPAGPFECELASAIQRSINGVHSYAQFRLRFDRAADSDGVADLAAFFRTDSNTNEPGIFELVVQVIPAE